MPKEIIPRDSRVSNAVHPLVSVAILALTLWLIISVWGFASDVYTDFLLVVVSGFGLVATIIPLVLWRVWRKDQHADARRQRLRDWTAGEFDTWQGPVKGANAAIEMLLPIAAVAFGMTAFAIVEYVTAHGGI
jgi:hypothetical protein